MFTKIKKVSIQLNHSLICGGMAFVERDGKEACIDFDVLKHSPAPLVVVGGRGKWVSNEEADEIEKALQELFNAHQIPLEIGTYIVSA